MGREILRGDIYYADLNPVVGSEQSGRRPCIIIQNNMGNKHSPTVIIAAITGKAKAKLPTHASLSGIQVLEKDSIALLEQIRTLDKKRLGGYIGALDEKSMKEVNYALALSVGLNRRDDYSVK